tara:strand:- start:292 stop:567 length:276 start_codon:yes stop_codon:yes gene_type:complete
VLRFHEEPEPEEDEYTDPYGTWRSLCPICENPVKPGDVAIRVEQVEVFVSDMSGQDFMEEVFMEDGSDEKLYHFACLGSVVPLFIIGAEPQ